MPDYRVYGLDGAGKIISAQWLEAKNDDEAIALARSLTLTTGFELWMRNRLVARIPGGRD